MVLHTSAHSIPSKDLFCNSRTSRIAPFPRSDGDPTHRPSGDHISYPTETIVEYRIASKETRCAWLRTIAMDLVWHFGWDRTSSKIWGLTAFPDGYELYTISRFTGNRMTTEHRLFGRGPGGLDACHTEGLIYGTANQFIPHARWLFEDASGQSSRCKCRHCGGKGKRQSEINEECKIDGMWYSRYKENRKMLQARPTHVLPVEPATVGRVQHLSTALVPLNTNSSQISALPTADTITSGVELGTRPSVFTGRSIYPETIRSATDRQQESHANLACLAVERESSTRNRAGEIVWLWMKFPIKLTTEAGVMAVRYWPAHVRKVQPKAAGEVHYHLDLLGTVVSKAFPGSYILPYQAHTPSGSLFDFLEDFVLASEKRPHERAIPHYLQTDTPAPLRRWEEPFGLGFAIAIQTARRFAECFDVTDEYVVDSQLFYKGLWWGPEFIRKGDLVRLTTRRDELRCPVLPSLSAAANRCIFLHVESIFTENDGSDDQPLDLFVCGPIFEVADHAADDAIIPLPDTLPSVRLRDITPHPGPAPRFSVFEIAGRCYPGQAWSKLSLKSGPLNRTSPKDWMPAQRAEMLTITMEEVVEDLDEDWCAHHGMIMSEEQEVVGREDEQSEGEPMDISPEPSPRPGLTPLVACFEGLGT